MITTTDIQDAIEIVLDVRCTHAMDKRTNATEARDVFVLGVGPDDLFQVTILNDLAGNSSLMCRQLTDIEADSLPGVDTGVHLAMLLVEYLDHEAADAEAHFYADLFTHANKLQLILV